MTPPRVLSWNGHHGLALATQFGWPVIPLHSVLEDARCSCRRADCESVGKHPATAHGLLDATTSAEQIDEWWSVSPNANVGLVTGLASGLIVVDVDGAPGDAALAAMGEIPVTVTSLTAKGRHLLFRRDDFAIRNSAKKLGPDLDVRADGGYIVAPPSRHHTGHTYRWAPDRSPWEVDVAPLPAALRARLAATVADVPVTSCPVTVPAPVAADQLQLRAYRYLAKIGSRGEGSRNEAAFQAAAFLTRDLALPVDTARAYIAEWNAFNVPPLSARELEQVIRSATKHARRPVGHALQAGIR